MPTSKARNKSASKPATDLKTVYADGTLSGVRIYLPCRIGANHNGMRYGGMNGLEVIGEEHKPPSRGTFIVLDSCGEYHWTRTLLNHLLPQRKVNQLLSCWGHVSEEQVVTVRTAVINYARTRLIAAGNDRAHNPVDTSGSRTWQIGGRRPVRLHTQP